VLWGLYARIGARNQNVKELSFQLPHPLGLAHRHLTHKHKPAAGVGIAGIAALRRLSFQWLGGWNRVAVSIAAVPCGFALFKWKQWGSGGGFGVQANVKKHLARLAAWTLLNNAVRSTLDTDNR